ncbi:MAG: C25 family cysteine peptidase [Chloroflexi bacterium]|nr:C25 family cysteine peptidase [Chloroflexota bacterium]
MFRIRRWAVILLVLGLASGRGDGLANAAPPALHPLAASPSVGAIADGLLLEWRIALPDLTRRADGTVAVAIPGYAQSDTPGVPQLPLTSELVVLPPGARPTLEIIQAAETDLPLPGPLQLAPRPAGVQRDAEGNVMGGAFAEGIDTPCFEAKGCPGKYDQPVTLTLLGTLRGVSLARLSFSPVRLVANQLRVTTHIQVVLKFNAAETDLPGFGKPGRSALSDPLLEVLKRSVLNPEQVQSSAPARPVGAMAPRRTGPPRAIVSVAQPGLTAISYASLAAIGFPLAGVDPQFLHLTRGGSEIAMQWEGNGNAVFETGERLLFVADPRFSRWTNTDGYYLAVGDQPGLRMTSRPANPAPQLAGTAWLTQTYEINALYTPTCYCGRIPSGRDGDRWAWDDVRRPDRASPTYDFGALPALDATQPATLTLWLISYTDLSEFAPDHRVDVALNGFGLGRIAWDGRQAITATFPVAPGVLAAADNVLSLNLPGVGSIVEGMWLDGFALRYARGNVPAGSSVLFTGDAAPRTYSLGLTSTVGLRGYDVTNPETPISLVGINPAPITVTDPAGSGGHRYLLAAADAIQPPAAMRLATELQPVSGADYLILSPSPFMPALTDLITLRQSQGLGVAVESLQAIYDAFDGRPTPEAIHTYLQNAYTTWHPRPAYVLLVGDGTFDPKLYRADSKETFLPPYLADVDPWMGETAADNRYVLLDGNGDILPDLLVGRLPVNTITETQIVVDKIVRYETDPSPGGWNSNVVFVADAADAGGDFAADSDQLASAFIQAPFTPRPIYYAPPATTVTDTQQAILTRWNAGAGLILYNGHASVRQWSAERLFHRDDVAALHNAGQLPVVLEMTCFTGLFHEPGGTTLDETLLRAAEGGAVAVWGATGLGVATGHQQLAQGFLASAFQRHAVTIGAGTLSGKLKLVASGSSALDLVDTFTLLGDPATNLNLTLVPWPNKNYLPIIQR